MKTKDTAAQTEGQIDRNEWPHGKAKLDAAMPLPTHDADTPPGGRTAGFLLYCHVYEARWAGLNTGEYCPIWRDVPPDVKSLWEALAGNIATEVARAASLKLQTSERRSPASDGPEPSPKR